MEWISGHYNLIISDRAQEDINAYIDTIMYTYAAPITAKKHYEELYNVFRKIQKYPFINAVRHNASLLLYGINVRRVNYKKMAVIYTIHENIIHIHRVIAGSMIID